MSKITIGKKEYEVSEQELNQSELLFYEENPRVYSVLNADGTNPTQEEIAEKMKTMEHVKQLRFSIEQNGGLIDPLIVVKRNNEYIVLEGNSRLAAYRILASKDPLKWQKVKCQILPQAISDSDIFTLLGQYHLVGRKDWSIFEQAAYLYRHKKSSGLENDILAKNVGLTPGKVNSLIEVYTFMLDNNDLRPDRWSYYEEYLKNRGIKKYRETSPQIDSTFVTQVKSGEIKQAMDVRVVLGEVAKSTSKPAKKIMQDIIEGKTTIYNGHDDLRATGKISNAYQKINKFRELIYDADFQKSMKLEATSSNNIEFELKKIKKAVEELLKDFKT